MGSALWSDRLVFRDYLRGSEEATGEYTVLKTVLAAEYQTDREAYTDAKANFVNTILERAKTFRPSV